MSLLGLMLIILVAGILLWAIHQWIPMDPKVLRILDIVVIVVLGLIVLEAFGLLDALRAVKVPRAQ